MTTATEKVNKKQIDYAKYAIKFLNGLTDDDLKNANIKGININYNLGQEGSKQVSSFRHSPGQN